METVSEFEWIIENFSHWCSEVHSECIQSPRVSYYSCLYMELYPKGIGGQGEHLVVHFCEVDVFFSGELSFHSSDGSLLYKQQVNEEEKVLELPLKFEDVLSRIREDFITVTLRIKDVLSWERRACTTINVLKLSLKINPKCYEEIGSKGIKMFGYIVAFSPNNCLATMDLYTYSMNGKVCFVIEPPNLEAEYPFAVVTSVSLKGSDDTVYRCVKKEHVFRYASRWTFPYSLEKKELGGKIISLFLCVKTKNFIQSPSFYNWDRSCFSIELKTSCFYTKKPLANPVTSNEVEVITKDSGSQTSLTSDIPDDSVLSKDLMCLYQDQDFSDVTLKCDNVTFPVHRAILSTRSPVFKTMLSSDMKETASGLVDIGDLDPSTLSLFLTYLYTEAVEDELQSDRALKLYYAADKYQVPSLKRDCSKFLRSNVSISNVCDILSLADRHQDDELTAVSHDFILKNYNDVLKSKEWDTLKKNEPLLALDTVTQFAVEDRVVTKLQPQ